MKRVVIIDGPIECTHECFNGCNIKQYLIDSNGRWDIAQNVECKTGHGTATANILVSTINDDVEIINFIVFDLLLKTREDVIISALEYIYKNVPCSIINMSLGMSFYNRRIHELCKLLYSRNVILVSSFDNWGGITFPAAFKEVIGVDASYKCINKRDFVYVENSVVDIKAKGGNQRVAWNNPKYVISSGSSFATPYVTAEIVNYCEKMNYEGIKRHFYEISKHQYCFEEKQFETNENDVFSITNAGLFPCNKEIHSFLNFKGNLSFQIEGVYDYKYSGQIGIKYTAIDGNVYIIENIEDCNWNKIDALIMGHVLSENITIKQNYVAKVIRLCLEHGINVFCFDIQIYKKYKECFEQNGLKIFSPFFRAGLNLFNKFGKLYKVKSPVMGVFGTSSNQGKFTLQLQLRQIFFERGYKVGQLGTEPGSLLFGMDACLPFGYNAPFQLNEREMVEAVNDIIHKIDLKHPDIIIAGCQSGTVPFDYNNAYKITTQQMFFLAGLNPDAVILCINCYEALSYIRRTIQVIEGFGRCKVICLAVSPLTIDSKWGKFTQKKKKVDNETIQCIIEKLQHQLHIPIIKIGDKEDLNMLYNICIDFFGE